MNIVVALWDDILRTTVEIIVLICFRTIYVLIKQRYRPHYGDSTMGENDERDAQLTEAVTKLTRQFLEDLFDILEQAESKAKELRVSENKSTGSVDSTPLPPVDIAVPEKGKIDDDERVRRRSKGRGPGRTGRY